MISIESPPLKLVDWINLEKINWYYLSKNEHEKAIHLLEQNPMKINWMMLSRNSNAVHLFEQNLDKIDWGGLYP